MLEFHKKKKNPKSNLTLPYEAVQAYQQTGLETDILGSYTGTPVQSHKDTHGNPIHKKSESELPIQDADDL